MSGAERITVYAKLFFPFYHVLWFIIPIQGNIPIYFTLFLMTWAISMVPAHDTLTYCVNKNRMQTFANNLCWQSPVWRPLFFSLFNLFKCGMCFRFIVHMLIKPKNGHTVKGGHWQSAVGGNTITNRRTHLGSGWTLLKGHIQGVYFKGNSFSVSKCPLFKIYKLATKINSSH